MRRRSYWSVVAPVVLVLLTLMGASVGSRAEIIKGGGDGAGVSFPFLMPDGTQVAPSLSWTNDPSLGCYLNAVGDMRCGDGTESYMRVSDNLWEFRVDEADYDTARISLDSTGADKTFIIRIEDYAGGESALIAMQSGPSGTQTRIEGGNGNALTVDGVSGQNGIRIATGGGKGTCNSGVEGTIYRTLGGAGVADTLEYCGKNTGNTYAWYPLVSIP